MKLVERDDERMGTILEIVRMSTEDGPGIRTTVFFKGCTLKCAWCHNPESISPKPQVQWIGASCIGCGICVKACPRGALTKGEAGIVIDRARCEGCGTCAGECPSMAMSLLGKRWSAGDLVRELVKDRAYFEKSGGGVTLSGGEASMQREFCLAVLKGLKAEGVRTALDTCGQVSSASLEALLPYVDLVLYDLKEIDDGRHREFTGAGNGKILEQAVFTANFVKEHIHPHHLWIRTPIIPGATATEENVAGIGGFIARELGGAVERWDLCAFNNLCRDKYVRLGMEWAFAKAPLLSRERMEELAEVARRSGVDPGIVSWSGGTLMEGGADEAPRRATKACGC